MPETQNFVLKDSGERQEFETGAVRDTQTEKGRFDLLPCHAIGRLAKVFERGATKYDERNWEQGIPLARYLDSALRHTFQFLAGARDEDHLAQAAWNLLCCIETEHWIKEGILPKSLYDLPDRGIPCDHEEFDKNAIDKIMEEYECTEEEAVTKIFAKSNTLYKSSENEGFDDF